MHGCKIAATQQHHCPNLELYYLLWKKMKIILKNPKTEKRLDLVAPDPTFACKT